MFKNLQNILLQAQENNLGPIQYAGELHDKATYRYFWELLQRAHINGAKLMDKTQAMVFS